MMSTPNGGSEITIARNIYGTDDMMSLVGKSTFNCLEKEIDVVVSTGQCKWNEEQSEVLEVNGRNMRGKQF